MKEDIVSADEEEFESFDALGRDRRFISFLCRLARTYKHIVVTKNMKKASI